MWFMGCFVSYWFCYAKRCVTGKRCVTKKISDFNSITLLRKLHIYIRVMSIYVYFCIITQCVIYIRNIIANTEIGVIGVTRVTDLRRSAQILIKKQLRLMTS